jgi:hypothetical protein
VVAGRGRNDGPKCLTKQTLDPVAYDGAADTPADRHAEALFGTVAIGSVLTGRLARECIQDEVPARHRFAVAVYAIELRAPRKTSALLTRSHVLRV